MRIGRGVKSFDPSPASARAARGISGSAPSFTQRQNASGPPPEIAFLAHYGVAPAHLMAAEHAADRDGVSPDQALLASGAVDERFFYQCLARHLGVAFIDERVELMDVASAAYPRTIHTGLVPFLSADGLAWLAAPRGPGLTTLLRAARRGAASRPRFAVTTPSHLSRCVRAAASRRIAADASFGLLSANPGLCAQSGATSTQKIFALILILSVGASLVLPSMEILPLAIGSLFLAAIAFRLVVFNAAMKAPTPRRCTLEDHELPVYTILIALYKEARIVRRLAAALDRLDYPLAKLDIKFLLEEDDFETRRALEALPLSSVCEIIIAPPGQPRTKPRALNVGLPLARGSLLVVFDAEDIPDPKQLRFAAERFAQAPPELACLQARLKIDNIGQSWLTDLFAIEYAALFEIQNPGLATLGLPLPLSGSSNHFRTSILHDIHGWDAWNVTEDADVGLRLARYGYLAGVLDSATYEEAPVTLESWLGQRQRWYKGWMQTLITISRSPMALVAELGVMRSLAAALLFTGLLLGPMFWLPTSLLLITRIAYDGLPASAGSFGFCLAAVWTAVSLLGLLSLLWPALSGMKRQRLFHLWPILPLLLPYYCLHTAAAWIALYQLFRKPFHWHKTEHGLASRPSRTKDHADEEALA